MKVTYTNPKVIRDIADDPCIVPTENRVGASAGHLFQAGEKAVLTGLKAFPEYNEEEVLITNVRENGEYGRAYYVKGRINRHLNWVYEYRLCRVIAA